MKIIKCRSYEELSKQAAGILCEQIKRKPNSVLGLATGSTPVGTYKILIEKYETGEIDFSGISTVNLDEYYPISPDNPRSYRYFMNHCLFDHVNIDISKTHVPYGLSDDPEKVVSEYDKMIDELGGIDLQLLGIGINGHIGFNEPESELYTGTHLTALTESTLRANSRYFTEGEKMPTHAITMGMGSIFKAKKIILLASGPTKASAVSKLMSGRITTDCPASLLQLHSDVTLICDEEAYNYNC